MSLFSRRWGGGLGAAPRPALAHVSLADEQTAHPSQLTGEPAPQRAEILKVKLLELRSLADVPQEGDVQL